MTNEGYAGSTNAEPRGANVCPSSQPDYKVDKYDLNQDGSTTDTLCGYAFDNAILPPPGSSELNSTKWVKGDLDTVFNRYPDVGNVTSGGNIDYEIRINNPSSAVKDLDIYDIFPSIGDRGVVSSELRYSAWRPTLSAPISLPSGVNGDISYTTVTNPCRDTVTPNGITPFPSGCNTANWSTIAPSPIGSATGVRFNLNGYTLVTGGSIVIPYKMKAATNSTYNNLIAWNSFGYVSTSVSSGLKLLPAEPMKVGIKYFGQSSTSAPLNLSFAIRNNADTVNSNTCDMGNLSSTTIGSCDYRLKVGTNSKNGYVVNVQTSGDFTSGGHNFTNAATGALGSSITAGNEIYGTNVTAGSITGAASGITLPTEFGTTASNIVKYNNTTSSVLATATGTNAPTTTGDTTNTILVSHKAAIGANTKAGTYIQTVTYTVVVNI